MLSLIICPDASCRKSGIYYSVGSDASPANYPFMDVSLTDDVTVILLIDVSFMSLTVTSSF